MTVASLYQMPVDPRGEIAGHRPADFWGRNILDHLLSLLPEMLEEDGVAYPFSPMFHKNIDQIRHVEQLSDAYYLSFGDEEVMVMYLLELRKRQGKE